MMKSGFKEISSSESGAKSFAMETRTLKLLFDE